MERYRLSEAADEDLDRLYDYGILKYGLERAESYIAGMISRFDEIALHPNLYPAVDSIRKGYRRCVYGAHSIYYRILDNEILIVRILGRQDPARHL